MKKVIPLMLASIFILAAGFMVYISNPKLWPVYAESQILINKIENFRKVNHRLPHNLKEISKKHWKDEAPPYYEKIDNDSYEVSFGIASVGESYVYNSKTKKWH